MHPLMYFLNLLLENSRLMPAFIYLNFRENKARLYYRQAFFLIFLDS